MTRIVALALLLSLAGRAAANGPVGDAPVFAKIEALRPVAAAIAIDGNGSDWGAIPSLSDANEAGLDAGLDITAVAIAPQADSLVVRIATKGAPSTFDLAFWLYVDYLGQERVDLEIGLYPGFPDIVWTYPEGGTAEFHNFTDSELAIGSVVEARVPYAQLVATTPPTFPPAMAAALTGPGARPWLRVTAFTRDYRLPGAPVIDTGPAVASFRLVPTPYSLDSAPPAAAADPALPMPPPLAGLWYLGQGGFGLGSHSGYWGYDFSIVDQSLFPDSPHPGAANTDYPSFGQTVRATVPGTVYSLENGQPDIPPLAGGSTPANFVYLDAGNDRAVLFTHLKQGTVAVTPSQSLAPGTVVGQVGNSGSPFSWPHLHLGAEHFLGGAPGVPIAFREVEVGLNPVTADPWLRWLETWDLREGYFTRPAGALCGDTEVDETLDAADVTALRARLANPAGAPLTTDGERRCTVIAPTRPCDVRDSVVLRRRLAESPLAPGISQVCPAALGS
jgi:hypothetical protein